ncbi:MAG: TonB-dependent receptor [Burkholderiales bacterium]|nr:TonB-dependent receptor [Opitutaceae bacterium]
MSIASRLLIVSKTLIAVGVGGLAGRAEELADTSQPVVELEPLTVYSAAVALQQPSSTFAMPVTLLRYESRVDVQARGFAEAQADISIRGGTFENTGITLGATPIYDPQTGHYYAELPIAPAMITAPDVRTGTAQASQGWNANAGGLAYGWQRIRAGSHGFATGGVGDNSLDAGELYVSQAAPVEALGGRSLGVDLSVAASQGEGSRTNGDHDFARYAGRVQLADERSQTDVFAGYQSKFFGWPNLYIPLTATFNETENLKTRLYALNHRVSFGADGDFFQVGANHRRNSDYYDPERTAPDSPVPFEHETKVTTTAFDGRSTIFTGEENTLALGYRAGVVADSIDSQRLSVATPGSTTQIGSGRFDDRTQAFVGLYPEYTTELPGDDALRFTTGLTYDISNRDKEALSPLAEAAWLRPDSTVRKVSAGYARSTQLPSYTALNSSPVGIFGGDSDLGRTTTDNFEVGAEALLAGWMTSASVFYRMDDDLVDWVFTAPPSPLRQATAVDIDTAGVELGARRSWNAFDLVFGYTYLVKDEADGSPELDASFYALNYARHRLTAALVARLGAGFELRFDNEARVQEDNPLRVGSDEAIISAIGLSWSVAGVKGLSVYGQVDNLWDEEFQEVPRVPSARREWSVGATYVW